MDPIIIMVGRANESVYDVEIMPDIPANDLADAVSQAFGWQGAYDIEVNGRRLLPDQTLSEVAAWDGSHITFVPSSRTPPSKKSSPQNMNKQTRPLNQANDSRSLQQLKAHEPVSGSRKRSLKTSLVDQGDTAASTPLKAWKSIDAGEEENAPLVHPQPPASPVVGWKFANPSDEKDAQDSDDDGLSNDMA